jgi:hypothetical protein
MIEQQMQLHRSLRAPVLRPVENRSTEFDETGVQSRQFVFKTETMRTASRQRSSSYRDLFNKAKHDFAEFDKLVNSCARSTTSLIGLKKIRARHSSFYCFLKEDVEWLFIGRTLD